MVVGLQKLPRRMLADYDARTVVNSLANPST